MKETFYLMLVALTVGMFTACDDDDENTTQISNPGPKEQWGKMLRSDNQTLLAFPDIYVDYREYTYSYKDSPSIGFCLIRRFPKSRFFNFTVYNDETQVGVPNIENVNIQPDDSSISPYVKETDDYGANGYTIYIIPANTSANACVSMKSICGFPEDINMVSIFMRLYLAKQCSGDEYGGTNMPAIQAFDVTTGEEVDFPKREKCNIRELLQLPPMNFSVDVKQLPFVRTPLSLMYPNSPTEYLSIRIKLNEGKVATFHFTPPTAPKNVSKYTTADVRYWSICLGSAEFCLYASICDGEMLKVNKEDFVTFIIADANSAKLPDLRTKAETNDGTYILTWGRGEQGDGIPALYRSMVINEDYPHLIHKLVEPVSSAAASGDMSGSNPTTMLAKLAVGNWGPQGNELIEGEYLSDSFSCGNIRK